MGVGKRWYLQIGHGLRLVTRREKESDSCGGLVCVGQIWQWVLGFKRVVSAGEVVGRFVFHLFRIERNREEKEKPRKHWLFKRKQGFSKLI